MSVHYWHIQTTLTEQKEWRKAWTEWAFSQRLEKRKRMHCGTSLCPFSDVNFTATIQRKNYPVKQSLIFQELPFNGDTNKSAKLAALFPLKLWAKVCRGIDNTRLTFGLSVLSDSSVHNSSKAYLWRRFGLTILSSQQKTNFRPRRGQKFEF